MHVSGKKTQRIVLKRSEASTQELRHLTLQVALKALLETQDMMVHTYSVLHHVCEKEYDISDETYVHTNRLIDAMQILGRIMNGAYINTCQK